MGSIYATEITRIGPQVAELLEEAGILIMFEEGAPPELAEMSVLHEHVERREEPPEVGDVVVIGDHEFQITAVGEKAWKNVLELGHASFKFDGAQEAELPGQICLEGQGAKDLIDSMRPGVRVNIRAAD